MGVVYDKLLGKLLLHDHSSSGGGGFSEIAASGDVDSVNTEFVFTEKPDYIVCDGVFYRMTSSSLVDYWTWDEGTLTATLAVPPTSDIFGILNTPVVTPVVTDHVLTEAGYALTTESGSFITLE